MTNIGYALARAELIRALTAYHGITTVDGAIGGTTLIDANLIGMNDFLTNKTILIGSGLAQNEDRGASAFNPATGQITLYSAFSSQILAGTLFRVLNISSVELDVALIDAKIGTNVDAVGTTTLFAWLAKIFLAMGSGEGLVYYGVVTAAAAPSFTIPTLAGYGAGKFADVTAPYRAFVLRDAGGGGLAPQGEMQPITAYVTGTGDFTAGAFTAAVAAGDEILIIHPRLAEVATILADMNVPAANAAANALIRDVVGNKTDTAVNVADGVSSLMRYVKGLLALSFYTEASVSGNSGGDGAWHDALDVDTRGMKSFSAVVHNTDGANSLDWRLRMRAADYAAGADEEIPECPGEETLGVGTKGLAELLKSYSRIKIQVQDTIPASAATYTINYLVNR